MGDENLTFTQYFQLFFDAVGNDVTVEERDEENPLFPDIAIPQGRGNWVRVNLIRQVALSVIVVMTLPMLLPKWRRNSVHEHCRHHRRRER